MRLDRVLDCTRYSALFVRATNDCELHNLVIKSSSLEALVGTLQHNPAVQRLFVQFYPDTPPDEFPKGLRYKRDDGRHTQEKAAYVLSRARACWTHYH